MKILSILFLVSSLQVFANPVSSQPEMPFDLCKLVEALVPSAGQVDGQASDPQMQQLLDALCSGDQAGLPNLFNPGAGANNTCELLNQLPPLEVAEGAENSAEVEQINTLMQNLMQLLCNLLGTVPAN